MENNQELQLTREQWLQECAALIVLDILSPVTQIRESMRVRVSVGFPPNTKIGNRTVGGICFSSDASSAGHNEIFITPLLDGADSIKVLGILTHELIHAVDDNESGHRKNGRFARICNAIGMVGAYPSALPGEALQARLQEYINLLGDIPHASIDYDKAHKPQQNRNLKVWCDCGFKFNTSRAQITTVLTNNDSITCCNCGRDMKFDV